MNSAVYNQKGEKTGEIGLPDEIFGVKLNPDLLNQVVLSQRSNRRRKIAKVKDRGEVRGGGKKPWRQKGTGRARHGSRRSPIWIGGGVTFGPDPEKNYKKVIPAKIRRKALLMVLSEKAKNEQVIILEGFAPEKPRTKEAALLVKKLIKEDSGGLVLPQIDKNLILSLRNIKKIRTLQAKDLNAFDLLNLKYLILFKDSIPVIKETFVK